MACFNLCRYKCEYGPQDYSGIVKPITVDLLPKPKKKPHAPDAVPEGNVLAPTKKARAKRAKGPNGRKPPRKFKSTGGVTFSIPDLNELPTIDDPLPEPAKIVKKRQPRKKLLPEPAGSDGPTPMVSVTGIDISTKTIKKRGPRKKKDDGIGSLLSALCDTGMGSNCPSSAHEITCACGEEVIGEVLNPDTAQTEGVGVDVNEEVQPVKNRSRLQRDSKKNGGLL